MGHNKYILALRLAKPPLALKVGVSYSDSTSDPESPIQVCNKHILATVSQKITAGFKKLVSAASALQLFLTVLWIRIYLFRSGIRTYGPLQFRKSQLAFQHVSAISDSSLDPDPPVWVYNKYILAAGISKISLGLESLCQLFLTEPRIWTDQSASIISIY